MNSDAEYPLEYSKEKYVMLRRSVFDAMQTRIDDLEVKLAAIADPKLDAESVRHLHETDPRPMTPAGLVHVSGTVTLNQWVAIRRVQQATLTREQEQEDE